MVVTVLYVVAVCAFGRALCAVVESCLASSACSCFDLLAYGFPVVWQSLATVCVPGHGRYGLIVTGLSAETVMIPKGLMVSFTSIGSSVSFPLRVLVGGP